MPDPGPWPALIFLWRRSLGNRWRGWARRLRQPRYAAGFVLGLAYFTWLAFGMARPAKGQIAFVQTILAAEEGLPLLAALAITMAWAGARAHMLLAFTPAEVHFLFQGPIARRTLLDYKLLRSQATLVPLALLFSAMGRHLLPLPWPLLALALWAMVTTIHLHQVAAGLVRASWKHHGRAGLRRQWIPMLLLLAAGLVLVGALAPLALTVRRMSGFTDFLQALDAALSRPAPAVVLLPFRLLVAPLVATHVGGWALGMLGTLALCGLHYAWVMRVDTAFEESAAQAGVELQAIISAAREGRGFAALRAQRRGRVRSPWFRLRPEGHPAVALFWKSFTAFSRNLSLGGTVTLVVILVGFRVLIGFTADSPHEAAMATAVVPAALAGMALFMGPLFLRNDLRTDFQRQELMRTFPLSGQSVVAAEVGASGASLAVVVAFFLTVSAAFFVVEGIAMPRPWIVPAAWLVSLVVATPLCVLAMGIQNLLVVAYPAWSSLGPTQQRGMDQTGTMILMMLVTGVLLAIGVLVPVFAGGAIAMRFVSALGLWVAVPAAMGAWLTLVGECVLLVVLLGDAYDALDPSEAGLLG